MLSYVDPNVSEEHAVCIFWADTYIDTFNFHFIFLRSESYASCRGRFFCCIFHTIHLRVTVADYVFPLHCSLYYSKREATSAEIFHLKSFACSDFTMEFETFKVPRALCRLRATSVLVQRRRNHDSVKIENTCKFLIAVCHLFRKSASEVVQCRVETNSFETRTK
jgi:hypothetical protein